MDPLTHEGYFLIGIRSLLEMILQVIMSCYLSAWPIHADNNSSSSTCCGLRSSMISQGEDLGLCGSPPHRAETISTRMICFGSPIYIR